MPYRLAGENVAHRGARRRRPERNSPTMTFPPASRLASSSRASCATRSHRPAADVDAIAPARASSTELAAADFVGPNATGSRALTSTRGGSSSRESSRNPVNSAGSALSNPALSAVKGLMFPISTPAPPQPGQSQGATPAETETARPLGRRAGSPRAPCLGSNVVLPKEDGRTKTLGRARREHRGLGLASCADGRRESLRMAVARRGARARA
jgi:hypothetical protein